MRRRRILVGLAAAAAAAALVVPASAAPGPSSVAALPSAVRGGLPVPVVRTIAVGSNPLDVELSQRLRQAFVLNDGSISVVSLATKKQVAEFGTATFHGNSSLALVRNDTWGYVANFNRRDVTVVDLRSQKVIGHIPIGVPGTWVSAARTGLGERAFVSMLFPRVFMISTATSKVITRTVVPEPIQTLTTRPGNVEVWGAGLNTGNVYVINTATGRLTRTITLDQVGPATSIAFTSTGRSVWVAGPGGVAALSATTGKVLGFVPSGSIFSGPINTGAVALTPANSYAVVENSTFPDAPMRGTIALISTRSFKVAGRVRVGVEPIGLAIDPRTSTAYVPNDALDTMSWFAVPR